MYFYDLFNEHCWCLRTISAKSRKWYPPGNINADVCYNSLYWHFYGNTTIYALNFSSLTKYFLYALYLRLCAYRLCACVCVYLFWLDYIPWFFLFYMDLFSLFVLNVIIVITTIIIIMGFIITTCIKLP